MGTLISVLLVFSPTPAGVDLADQPVGAAHAKIVRGEMRSWLRQPKNRENQNDLRRDWQELVHTVVNKIKSLPR